MIALQRWSDASLYMRVKNLGLESVWATMSLASRKRALPRAEETSERD